MNEAAWPMSTGTVIERPSYLELALILLTGVLHVAIELAWGAGVHGLRAAWPERLYTASVTVIWCTYVLWRGVREPGLRSRWGFRLDNALPAFCTCLLFVIPATAILALYAIIVNRLAIPTTFWTALLLYPLYGIAQQFALQVLVTRNLRALISRQALRVFLVAAFFSAAHFPNQPLMTLTFIAGLGFTLVYEVHPNLWVVGIAHGFLGALAYHWVLGLDPGAEIIAVIQQAALR